MAEKSLTRDCIAIDHELTYEDNGICAYIETWFDVDEKFSLDTKDADDTWVNFYATYNPDTADFSCIYTVNNDKGSAEFPYTPTSEEIALITAMMEETCIKEYGCDMREFWNEKY